jgi:thioredoxin
VAWRSRYGSHRSVSGDTAEGLGAVVVVMLTDNDFDEATAGSGSAVLVDFGADWCEPCKAMEPILDELAVEYAGRMQIVRIDVDQSPDVTGRLEVMSLPTLVFMRSGAVVHRIVGALGKGDLTAEVDAFLEGGEK